MFLIGAVVFTQAGEDLLTDIIDGTTAVPTNWYVGWGTGAGTAAKGDTVLFTEASESRVITTDTQPTSDTNRFVGTITADGTKTITNAGILSASTAGTLFIHGDHTSTAVNLNDSIQYTIEIQWS